MSYEIQISKIEQLRIRCRGISFRLTLLISEVCGRQEYAALSITYDEFSAVIL